MLSKEQILTALSAWIRQRPGLEFGNYGELSSYRAELRQIAKDKRDAETLLAAVAIRDSITAEDVLAGFRAYSGRLTISEDKGRAKLEYCTGQYWPTEYRKAAAAVLASVLWERKRADVAVQLGIVNQEEGMMEREHFGLFEYREAKAFLADAVVVRAFHYSNVHSNVTYRKPDGSLWDESECHLEAPESSYSLTQRKE